VHLVLEEADGLARSAGGGPRRRAAEDASGAPLKEATSRSWWRQRAGLARGERGGGVDAAAEVPGAATWRPWGRCG
jgi:hypothetical protein